jgi:hypothetical protein
LAAASVPFVSCEACAALAESPLPAAPEAVVPALSSLAVPAAPFPAGAAADIVACVMAGGAAVGEFVLAGAVEPTSPAPMTSTGALNIDAHVCTLISPVGMIAWRRWKSSTAARVSGP